MSHQRLKGKKRDEHGNYSNEEAAMQRAVRKRGPRQKPLSAAPFQSVPIQSRVVWYVDDGNVCRIGRKEHS